MLFLVHVWVICVCCKRKRVLWKTVNYIRRFLVEKSRELETWNRLPTPIFYIVFDYFFWVQSYTATKESGVSGFLGVKSGESEVPGSQSRESESEIQSTDPKALTWINIAALLLLLLHWQRPFLPKIRFAVKKRSPL